MNLMAVAVADYIGFVLVVAMLVSSKIRRAAPRDEFKLLTIIAFLSAIACVLDFVTFYCDGKTFFLARIINHFGNTYSFVANPVFAMSWCIYTDLKLYHSRARIKRVYRFAMIPGLILLLLALVNIFVPIVYYLDENNVYHRLPGSYAFYVIEFFYLMWSVITLIKYEERFDKVNFFPMYLMIGPIVLGSVLQVIFYGVSLIWVSMAIGLTCIYMALQNEFSYQDTLTGLFNRAYLDYLLDKYTKNPENHVGGIMVDVDYFKGINDTYGHHVGDEALIDVARILLFGKPDKAIVMRFAGDEFILLLKDCNEEFLKKVVTSIRDELKLFNETENRQYQISLSLGYTLFEYGKDDSDSFFKKMDDNMYEEKKLKHAKR